MAPGRPWKRAELRIHVSAHHEDAATTVTARTLRELWLDRVLRRAKQYLTSDDQPEGWRGAEESSQSVAFLTADEARELAEEMLAVIDRYKDRHSDVAKRPPGVLPVETVFFAYPLTGIAGLAAETGE